MPAEIRHARKEDFYGVTMNAKELQSCYAYLKASAFAWTGLINKEIACVWGLVPPTILSDSAYLWLLTTPVVDEHRFTFVRHSQMVIEGLFEQFPIITGHVLADHTRSKRWLKWLGVKFMPAVGEGRLIPFELRRAARG